ncbi:MAG: hypothetical protein JWO67_4032 [Streptosporangiaceae bacterium]|nr:hypothetical protein [Streptosporangiaceae bacterium]
MKLPKGTHLAYIVDHDTWYSQGPRVRRSEYPSIMIQAAADDGGVAWEFPVEGTRIGAIRASLFSEAWQAFQQMPEFFFALAEFDGNATLKDVRGILDRLGAVDETERTRPTR